MSSLITCVDGLDLSLSRRAAECCFGRGQWLRHNHLMTRRALFSTRTAGILCVAILNQSGGHHGLSIHCTGVL